MTAEKLDPREEHFRIPSHHPACMLFLRYLPSPAESRRVVLYVLAAHSRRRCRSLIGSTGGRGATLCDAGFHVWALDFLGFGRLSDPFPEVQRPSEEFPPLCRAEDASRQLEHAVRHICDHHRVERISIIAHSWGTIVTGRFAGRCRELVDRLVFFGPIAQREPKGERARLPGWRLISLEDQWNRFTETVPSGEAHVLLRRHFKEWGERYLDVDPESRARSPAAVKVPSGAFQDIYDAWAGELAYDPGLVQAPVSIIRGQWDTMCTDQDARWLFDALAASPIRRDVKISRATHLMHLEASRYALYREAEVFLSTGDTAPGGE